MMGKVYLEVDDLETLIAFIQDAKKVGLLKDVSTAQVRNIFSKKEFPLRVPVDLNAILNVANNKVVKATFGKRIEAKTVDILNGMLSAT